MMDNEGDKRLSSCTDCQTVYEQECIMVRYQHPINTSQLEWKPSSCDRLTEHGSSNCYGSLEEFKISNTKDKIQHIKKRVLKILNDNIGVQAVPDTAQEVMLMYSNVRDAIEKVFDNE